jgi:hypothetical protein
MDQSFVGTFLLKYHFVVLELAPRRNWIERLLTTYEIAGDQRYNFYIDTYGKFSLQ